MKALIPVKHNDNPSASLKWMAALTAVLYLIISPVQAYDQPWNGNREDITNPAPPPPPPCPGGNCKCPNSSNTSSPVYTADGALVWSDVDIRFPIATQVGLKRTYNSFDYRAGLFGRGWVTAQESNIARTYKAITEGNPDGSPKNATEFGPVPIWLASYGRRYTLEETATQCSTPGVLYFTFQKEVDGKFKQVFEDNESFSIYSATGVLLESYSDKDGVTLYYEYDDRNRLQKQIDSYGFALNFFYNEQGFVSQVSDQAGRVWGYTYDEYGRLIQVLAPDGNSKDYGYQLVDKIGYKQHLLNSVDDNIDDPVLKVTWSSIAIGSGKVPLMRVASYTESDGNKHEYSYAATTFNGQPAIRVVKNTKQVNSNSIIKSQTIIADANNYQIFSDVNNTENLTNKFIYDDRGNIIEETDERGNITQYEYNLFGRRTKTIELVGTAGQKEITFSYWNNTDRVAVMNEYGVRETGYTYDGNLRVLTETQTDLSNNQQRVWTYAYHPNVNDNHGNIVLGELASVDGPLPGGQDLQTFEYNAQGLLIKATDPFGQSVAYAYNSVGQQVRETDLNGIVTEMTYDSQNRLIKSVRNNKTSQVTYNSQGQMIRMIDELGRTTNLQYDDFNQPIKISYPSGDYIVFDYIYGSTFTEISNQYFQADGTLVSTKVTRNNPETKFVVQEYLSNLSEQVSEIKLNGLNDLTQKALYGKFGNEAESITNYTYDGEGYLTQIQDGEKGNTNFEYDHFGILTKVTDSNNAVTKYSLSAWGELLQLTSPDTGTTTFQVNPLGNTTNQVNANNISTDYIYDLLGRITKIDYEGDTLDVSFSYDEGLYGKGFLTSVTDASGSSKYTINDSGLLAQSEFSIQGVLFRVNFGFNDADEVNQISYPSGAVVKYNYDASGRFSGIQLSDGNGIEKNIVSAVTWHGANLSGYQLGNGVNCEYGYDTAARLIEKRCDGADNRIQNELDNQGQVVKQTLTRNSIETISNFEYDKVGRLVRDGSALDGLDWIFEYDSNGNRLNQKNSDLSNSISFSYEPVSNLLSQVSGEVIQRDAVGNTLNDGIRQYQYNSANRLEMLSNNQLGIQALYSYNYQGQRVRKVLSGNQVEDIRYVYGFNGELLGEYDLSGNRIREYIYHREAVLNVSDSTNVDEDPDSVVDSLVAVIDSNGSVYYVHTDHLEIPRLATDNNQVVVWRWDSDAFGVGVVDEDPDLDGFLLTINHRFPGQFYDNESGLHYNFFRYYDSEKGRYITSDPIGLGGGLNTYSYSSSNPLNDYDQRGMVCGTGLCVAVVVTVGRVAIVGWKAYKNYKKWKKAQKLLCRRLYSVYKAACKVPCKGISGCKPLTFAAAAAETCVTGRKTYVGAGCDSVFPTKRDHPGQAKKAANALENCRKRRDKACQCPNS